MADFKISELDESLDFDNLPYWDVVIIGAGPAGLAASLTTAHRGLTTLVIEAKDKPGGQPQFLYADKRIVDIPGFPDGITGADISERTYRQAANALVQFRFEEELQAIEDTEQVERDDPLKRVVTTRDSYLCRKVIIGCGLLHFPRKLPVLDQLQSKKVHYKIPKIGDYEGSRVAVPRGTSSVQFVRRQGGRVVLVDGAEEALAMAAEGSVAAAVFDRAVLGYYLARDPDLDLVLSERSYDPVGYGFCVRLGSDLEDLIDIELLALRESPRMETIRTNWLGE